MKTQNNITVFRTGKVYEFDMVRNELDDARIPTFSQEQTSAGLRLATPATLTADAGTWWSISVPEEYAEQAQQIILSLPCDHKTDPEVWDFATPTAKQNLQWFYRINAALWVLGLLWYVIQYVIDRWR